KSKEGFTPLYIAAVEGYENIVEPLLRYGAKVDAEDKEEGTTPLHLTAKYGDTNLAKAIITKGANVNAVNRFRETPLDYANKKGSRRDLAKVISDAGRGSFKQASSKGMVALGQLFFQALL
ncbi:MAG: ankyrin repeat domain-containing protein, partial [Wolbachia sp.]